MDGQGEALAEAMSDESVNSFTNRASYMRFVRKMSGKRLRETKPELIESFNDKAKRAVMFEDWFKSGEKLEEVELGHKRRIVQKKKAAATFRPLSKKDLLKKYHNDAEHVEKIIADCKNKNRYQKDKYAPHDEDKWLYWILDDQSVTLSNAFELEAYLKDSSGVDAAQVQQLTADGGAFSIGGGVGLPGMSGYDVAVAHDNLIAGNLTNDNAGVDARNSKGSRNGRNGTGKGKTAAGSGKGKGNKSNKGGMDPEAGEQATEELKPEQPLVQARRLLKSLAKNVGEAREMLLQLRGLHASETLVDQIKEVAVRMEKQYASLQVKVNAKINDESIYLPFKTAVEKLLDYYATKKQFANALIGVAKRQAKDDEGKAEGKVAGEPEP